MNEIGPLPPVPDTSKVTWLDRSRLEGDAVKATTLGSGVDVNVSGVE